MIGAPFVSRLREPHRAYRWGVGFTGASFVCAFLAWLGFYIGTPTAISQRWSIQPALFGRQIFSLDELNAPLVPAIALLHPMAALATSRAHMRRFSFSWSLAAAAIRLTMFSCKEPWILVGLLSLETIPPFVELLNRGRTTRVYMLHIGLFVALLALGWAAIESSSCLTKPPPWWATLPLLAAILIHCGTVLPASLLADRLVRARVARNRPALLFVTPLSGVYAAVRLVLPIGPGWVLESIGLVSSITAVYSAGMATVQRETRRFFAHHCISPRIARGLGRPRAAYGAHDDRLAQSVVLCNPLLVRLRPDTPLPRGPRWTALVEGIPRPLRTLSHAGCLLLVDRSGERLLPRHTGLHRDGAAGR